MGVAQETEAAGPFPFGEGKVAISGQIDAYRGVYDTGKLSVFDGVTRQSREVEFRIDESGRFRIEERIAHAVYGTAVLDLEGVYHALFLEPGKDLDLRVDADGLRFLGESGALNRELDDYSGALAEDLATSIEEFDSVHTKAPSPAEGLDAYQRHAERRREHLAAFAREKSLSPRALSLLASDIEAELAHASISLRYRSDGGRVRPREDLPDTFLRDLLQRHPIDELGVPVSRRAIDYLANIVQVLEKPEDDTMEARLSFDGSQNVFSSAELKLLGAAFGGDRSVLASAEFRAFDTSENRAKEFVLRKRYRVDTLLGRVETIPASLPRDLLVSQGIARNYLAGDLIEPTDAEWHRIGALVDSGLIVDMLRRAIAEKRGGGVVTSAGATDGASSGQVARLLEASRGKVVYIDFWATWCAPCRAEIPAAKRLERKLATEDVVFLNLCARSRREDWSRMVAQKELGGEQMFLEDPEYELFAKRFGVRGFPTYVLIGKGGKVASKSAPRPSSGEEIENLIRSLLR